MKKYFIFIIIIFSLFLSRPDPASAETSFVMAQDNVYMDGLVLFGENTILPNVDLPVFVGKLIEAALSLSGLILVCIFLYGGLIWMLALGNEDQVKKAKDSMIQGVIGLVIVSFSYSIANYLLNIINLANGS